MRYSTQYGAKQNAAGVLNAYTASLEMWNEYERTIALRVCDSIAIGLGLDVNDISRTHPTVVIDSETW